MASGSRLRAKASYSNPMQHPSTARKARSLYSWSVKPNPRKAYRSPQHSAMRETGHQSPEKAYIHTCSYRSDVRLNCRICEIPPVCESSTSFMEEEDKEPDDEQQEKQDEQQTFVPQVKPRIPPLPPIEIDLADTLSAPCRPYVAHLPGEEYVCHFIVKKFKKGLLLVSH